MERIDCEHCFNSEFYDGDKLRCKLKKCKPRYDYDDEEETDRMNKLSNEVIEIVEKYKHYAIIPPEEGNYLTEQINKVYHAFFRDIHAGAMRIENEPTGKPQGKGQYCERQCLGWGTSVGTYYFPIENGKYLAMEFS